MQIEVESLSPDRTITWFRDPNEPSTHWGLEIVTDPNGRAYYTVTHDGWVVQEVTAREVRVNERGTIATEVFRTYGPMEAIPACVASHLPQLVRL